MGKEQIVEQLASLEVDLINRIFACLIEEEDTFEYISRQLVEKPEHEDLQNFINHALTGVLLAVAFHRFKETMKPFLSPKEIDDAFMRMTHNKAKNVVDHWHEQKE